MRIFVNPFPHSESPLAIAAPNTTKCDFCLTSFCGVAPTRDRCTALSLMAQQLDGLADLGEFIQNSSVYEAFNNNTVEVDFLVDYMTSRELTPRSIYREVRSPWHVFG